MQVESFTFRRNESYASERPNELVGRVTLSGPTGRQEIVLQAQTMIVVLNAIKADVVNTSRKNADLAKGAIEEAIHGPLLNAATAVAELT